MRQEKDAAYYDEGYKKLDNYSLYWRESNHAPLYEAVCRLMTKDNHVLDIGCGTGQMANALLETESCKWYTGFDFSRVAIEKAKQATRGFNNIDLFVGDAYNLGGLSEQFFSTVDCVLITETLEHLDDIKVLEKLKSLYSGKVIISVPPTDDPAHVRVYPTFKYIRRRFRGIIQVVCYQNVMNRHLFVAQI